MFRFCESGTAVSNLKAADRVIGAMCVMKSTNEDESNGSVDDTMKFTPLMKII
jgi:hypothetical protein